MTGRPTIWGAGEILTTFFGNADLAKDPPPALHLALIRSIAPTPYMSGAELDEPEATDYARVEITNDTFNWANDSQPHLVSNLVVARFVPAVTDWGECRYWALCNASVDGFNYLVGELESPILVEAGDTAEVSEGDLCISLGPFFMGEDTE